MTGAFRRLSTIDVFAFTEWSARRGVRHFVTTRRGGVSREGFRSLNLGFSVGDDPGHVRENRRRVAGALGLEPGRVAMCRQVHGDTVRIVTGDGIPSFLDASAELPAADAMVTSEPGVVLAVLVADCVPVLVHDPVTPAVGIAHAGWRGTVAGVTARLIETLVRTFDSKPEELWAAIGPSIGPSDYQVSLDVVSVVRSTFPTEWRQLVQTTPTGSTHLDLWGANALQLRRAGVPESRILTAGISTASSRDWFFSHRAAGTPAGTGRFAAGIGVT